MAICEDVAATTDDDAGACTLVGAEKAAADGAGDRDDARSDAVDDFFD